jgi:DNA replicative helicase MCM subunit Mcm2 (Cdc46/Mcm family)
MTPPPPPPMVLTPHQNEQLMALWKSHSRELVDVKLSCESRKIAIPSHAYAFILRLHTFLKDFLEAALKGCDGTQAAPDGGASTSQRNPFLKEPHSSSLQAYAKFALITKIAIDRQKCKEIRLQTGRRVIALHHEDFLRELNQYEVRGTAPSDEFVRRESFGAFLYHMPETAIKSLGCSMALAMATLAKDTTQAATVDRFLDSTQIVVRFAHLQPKIQMMDIKTGLVGKMLTIKGHVVKARPKRLCVATADFCCLKCGTSQTHSFDRGRYSVPTQCANSESCRSKSFTLVRPTARYIDAQEIRLQEAQEENTVQAGRTPRQIEVELTHDMVDVCRPGDIVLVAATVAAINTAVAAGQMGKRAKETSTYKLYLQGHSVTTMSESNNRRKDQGSQVIYTQQQLRNITQLCHADHRYFRLEERRAFPFDLLVRSICPAIIGHNEVKAGLLLCLLGGTPPASRSSDRGNSIRCNSHILIVGDPGMGKSQMLLAATQLAARSVYVGGNTSSTTGLTVTLTKEERGETGIEAGALVLADQGICAIDEFDKMAKNHQDGKVLFIVYFCPVSLC